jgi:hypothetical protein
MISAFVSRDSGFGLPVREDQLQLINAYRQGKQYVGKAAALEILKTVEKPPLNESPVHPKVAIGIVSIWHCNLKTPLIAFIESQVGLGLSF